MKTFMATMAAIWIVPLSSLASHDEIEDIFNRYGGPPLYRYYHLVPSHDPHEKYERWSYKYDANQYWGSRYYGNVEPDPYDVQRLDYELYELMELEGKN